MSEGTVRRGRSSLGRVIGRLSLADEEAAPQRGEGKTGQAVR